MSENLSEALRIISRNGVRRVTEIMDDADALRAALAACEERCKGLKKDLAEQLPMRDADAFVIGNLNATAAALTAKLDAANAALLSMTDAIQKLLEVLPDAARASDCWTWCWDELDGDAQDEVKTARAHAVSVMLATAAHDAAREGNEGPAKGKYDGAKPHDVRGWKP